MRLNNKLKPKRRLELDNRRKLKQILIAELPDNLCPVCGTAPDWRGLQLCHRKALSLGGKTDRENCYIACAHCHFTVDHKLRENK